MKAVFDTKPTSAYDDEISQHYQFPRRYLATVQRSVDDWIVLRRPRADGGTLAYFATARVLSVEPDLATPGMSYARLAECLPFDRPVPWTSDGRYAEEALRNIPQAQVGVFLRGRSVRPLSEDDFAELIAKGLTETLDVRNAERLGVPVSVVDQAAKAVQQPLPPGECERRVEAVLTNRVIREASFRKAVYDAYDNRCAATGLRIIDRRGNSEVHAAHIWAVADGGPDVIQNGLALTATVHWLFDRYLLSITDDHMLLIAEQGIPTEILALLGQNGSRLHLPPRAKDWPHPVYLKRHRNKFSAITASATERLPPATRASLPDM